MIPYDYKATHVRWFEIWKSFVKSAQSFPDCPIFGKHAAKAQMHYVCEAAIAIVEYRNKYI